MRILKSISAQLTLIMLICYLLPATVLGFYMGGTMIRDEQAKTEAALLSGMEFSRLLTDQNLSRVVALARAATYDGELDSAVSQRNTGAITDGEFLRTARAVSLRRVSAFGGTDASALVYVELLREYEARTGNVVEDSSGTSDESWKASVLSDFAAGDEPDILFFFACSADSAPILRKMVPISEINAAYPDLALPESDIPRDADPAGNYIVRQALDYMRAHCAERLSLGDVADQMYVSQWHLSKLINRHTNQSFLDLLGGMRIEKAKGLLADSTLRVHEVADQCGFSDLGHFSRSFKKLTGQTPGEYRDSARRRT